MSKRLGKQTVALTSFPSINAFASIVGEKEGQGPLGLDFDAIEKDPYFGEETWEKAESRLYERGLALTLSKSLLTPDKVNYIFAGDLLNQCISSTFGIRSSHIPFYGVYGACSTMSEGLSIASMLTDGGFSDNSVVLAGSHFCSSEKQFRFPLDYGGQRTPTAQWTVTGMGGVVVGFGGPIKITHVTTGTIEDYGITDSNNMGAAMAPAFAATLTTHLEDTGRSHDYYDLIISGDLGIVGKAIAEDLLGEKGIDICNHYDDCGVLIFDGNTQDTHAGGSGCGCSASVLCGHFLPKMAKGELKKVLFIATGALMSPTSVQQGESIPSIAHAVALEVM